MSSSFVVATSGYSLMLSPPSRPPERLLFRGPSAQRQSPQKFPHFRHRKRYQSPRFLLNSAIAPTISCSESPCMLCVAVESARTGTTDRHPQGPPKDRKK